MAGLLVFYMSLYVAYGFGRDGGHGAALRARPGLLLAPAAWVATEYGRAHIFGGFPWIPLGNAVVTLLPIAQIASLVGVYGLSWLLALLNATFAIAAVTTGRRRLAAIALALALVAVPSFWGSARMSDNR